MITGILQLRLQVELAQGWDARRFLLITGFCGFLFSIGSPSLITLKELLMKSYALSFIVLLASGAAFSQAAPSANGAGLAAKHGCLICHNVDNKVVGPAFKAVAEKYRGQDVNNTLVLKVTNGGAGQWGRVPMPPHPNVPQGDLKEIVTWILGLPS